MPFQVPQRSLDFGEENCFQFCVFIINFCDTYTQILIKASCFISAESLFVLVQNFAAFKQTKYTRIIKISRVVILFGRFCLLV